MTSEELETEPKTDDPSDGGGLNESLTTATITTAQNSDFFTHPNPNGCDEFTQQKQQQKTDANNATNAKVATKRRPSEGSNLAALRKRYRGGGIGGGSANGPRFSYDSGMHHNNNNNALGNSMILPHKFHLGGNITDPLNLNGLINRTAGSGTVTPPSDSPAALRSPVKKHHGHVDALVARLPCNPNDPLNLNAPEQEISSSETPLPDDANVQLQMLQQQTAKMKRKRKGSTSLAETNEDESSRNSAESTEKSQNEDGVTEKDVPPFAAPVKKLKAGPNLNRIVSPAIPQGIKPRQNSSGNSSGNANHHPPLARKKSGKNDNKNVQKLANGNGGNSSSDADSAKASNASSSNASDDRSGIQEKLSCQDNAAVNGNQGNGKKKQRRKRRLSTKSNNTNKSSSDTSSNKNQGTSGAVAGSVASSTTTTSGERDSKMPSAAFGGSGGPRGKNGGKVFDRGNYNRYYGSRNPKGDEDPRFQVR